MCSETSSRFRIVKDKMPSNDLARYKLLRILAHYHQITNLFTIATQNPTLTDRIRLSEPVDSAPR